MSNEKEPESKSLGVLCDVEDEPPLKETIPLGLQHVLVMFSGNVSIPPILPLPDLYYLS